MATNTIARKLMASTAVSVVGMLLVVAPASAQQGQVRGEGRGGVQANESVRGGMETRGSVNSRARDSADMRGARAERGARAGADARVRVRADTQTRVRSRDDVRIRANVNANTRTVARSERRHVWNDNVRYRDDGARVRAAVGYADPYYSYAAYDDGYYAYGAAEPYAQYEPYRGSDSYYSYAASPGCACAPAPYAAWNTEDRWHRGGIGIGFSAW